MQPSTRPGRYWIPSSTARPNTVTRPDDQPPGLAYHMNLFTTPAGDYGLHDSEPGHRYERKAPLDTVAPTVDDTQLGYGV